ncbi:uncharacterized protein N7483_004901 [Penicillium malachiteum]|uniref:uncharacterized protein n=1 Tax=Penicillium malachiteum TaxID=1324776 RepID=UPI002546D53B|nr:uncharacterized protein N7483_004901 [Penicillium malachiteum]KAJ5730393.1 hypothetical protein N7483_004901 [Penicillium malachiteum]
MAKKGGKGKKKGGAKATAAAAVDKVADKVENVNPSEETPTNDVKPESVEQTEAPIESQATETPAAAAVTDSKAEESETKVEEAEKKVEEAEKPETVPETQKAETTVQDAVDKAQASKDAQASSLDAGEKQVKSVLPESSVKETSVGAEIYPSTSETAAEESATSTAAGTTALENSLPERPKTSESTKAPATAAAAIHNHGEPATVPSETLDAAHTKRPYEKPIFSNDEVKPPKMAKTEEEEKQAVTETPENLAGAGPASTAAYTAPEPVPVAAAPTVTTDFTPVSKPVAESKPIAESKLVAGSPSKANPDAVAAANAALNSSKSDKGAVAAAEGELKKPEAALKREETKATEAPQQEAAPSAQEPAASAPAQGAESKADEPQTSEQAEKKKGGFFARLKRMFK